MIKKVPYLLILCFIISISKVYSSDFDSVNLGGYKDADGVVSEYRTSQAAVLKSPSWNGVPEDLPLSMTNAISIASKWVKKENPKFDTFILDEIILRRIGHPSIVDRWYYNLGFMFENKGRLLYGATYNVKLLLDGTIIEPIVKK